MLAGISAFPAQNSARIRARDDREVHMLEGIRVVDFTQYLPGPYATLRLADMGAEIIKVEPLQGELGRHFGPKKENESITFQANNQNKKSIAINLKHETGREIVLRLINQSDIVIESFRPGVMQKLGLDYETVKQRKPEIIYCSITGYGQTGRHIHQGSHDLNYLALSGILSQLKDGCGKPVHPTITLADFIGGMAACEAILAALIKRGRDGRGSWIDLSLMDALVSFMQTHRLLQQETGRQNGPTQIDGSQVSYAIYQTKDERCIVLAALEEKFWKNFCTAVQKEHWMLANETPPTNENPVYREMVELFRSRTLEEWLTFGQAVDCCLTPVLEVEEIVDHPVVKERWAVMNQNRTSAPKIGDHTVEVLNGLLQVTESELAEWKAQGIVT